LEHHRELVDLWEGYVRDDAEKLGGKPLEGGLAEKMDRQWLRPWYLFDRFYLKGGMKAVQHYDFYGRAPDLLEKIREKARGKGYPAEEVGQAIIPVYFGGACYLESDLYYDPSEEDESRRVNEIRLDSYRYLLDRGSFIDRPRGKVAEMAYGKVNEGFVKVLKTFKSIVDPAGIMNPDQLLEGV
jgi:hypothetical protein